MRAALLISALLLAAPAAAQDTSPPPPVSVSASATALTDYRFRGVSRSGGDPAVQAQVEASALFGLYGGVLASSTGHDDPRTGLRGGPGDAEIDLFAGYQRPLGPFQVDGGLRWYTFAGHTAGRASDYFEPAASLRYSLGPASASVGAAYAWGGQDALRGRDSLYLRADASLGLPGTPLTFKAHVGRTDGALGRVGPVGTGDTYTDWSATAEASRGMFRIGLSYVDTDVTSAGNFAGRYDRGATVLAYVGVAF